MDFVGHMVSFLVPIHTHIFGNDSNGYSHLNTAPVKISVDRCKSESSMG
jgi:hypothetical protein